MPAFGLAAAGNALSAAGSMAGQGAAPAPTPGAQPSYDPRFRMNPLGPAVPTPGTPADMMTSQLPNPLAPPTAAPPAQIDPYARYQADFAQGMSAARGHLAAAYGAALNEINANRMGGQAYTTGYGKTVQGQGAATQNALAQEGQAGANALANSGFKQTEGQQGGAYATANAMQTATEQSTVPMIAAGVQANALAAKNQAESQRQSEQSALDAQQAQFTADLHAKQDTATQARQWQLQDAATARAAQLQDQATQWAQNPNNPNGSAYNNPLKAQQAQDAQSKIDNAGYHFDAAQAAGIRQSAAYKNLSTFDFQHATTQEIQHMRGNPEARAAMEVYFFDQGQPASKIPTTGLASAPGPGGGSWFNDPNWDISSVGGGLTGWGSAPHPFGIGGNRRNG